MGDISNRMLFDFLTVDKDRDSARFVRHSLMPSLKHISTVKIVTSLWNHATVRDEIMNRFPFFHRHSCSFCSNNSMFEDCNRTNWEKVEDLVLSKVSKLPLPNCICKMLLHAVNPIGKEIMAWIEYQHMQFIVDFDAMMSFVVHRTDSLIWTPRGRIDYAKTAKVMLLKAGLSDDVKYQIACTYCLVDDVVEIASHPLYSEPMRRRSYSDGRAIIAFWAHLLQRDPFPQTPDSSEIDDFYFCLFKGLICCMANPVVIKYMWQLLSSEKKGRILGFAMEHTRNFDLLIFFLLQVPEEQREIMFRLFSNVILKGLITDWPWKDYFLMTICLMWKEMSGSEYFSLLTTLVHEMIRNAQDGRISVNPQDKMMLRGMWERAPGHLKEWAFEYGKGDELAQLLSRIFYWENIDIVQLILSSANSRQKKQVIHSRCFMKRCASFVKPGQCNLSAILVACSLSCKADVDDFKARIAELNGNNTCTHCSEMN